MTVEPKEDFKKQQAKILEDFINTNPTADQIDEFMMVRDTTDMNHITSTGEPMLHWIFEKIYGEINEDIAPEDSKLEMVRACIPYAHKQFEQYDKQGRTAIQTALEVIKYPVHCADVLSDLLRFGACPNPIGKNGKEMDLQSYKGIITKAAFNAAMLRYWIPERSQERQKQLVQIKKEQRKAFLIGSHSSMATRCSLGQAVRRPLWDSNLIGEIFRFGGIDKPKESKKRKAAEMEQGIADMTSTLSPTLGGSSAD